MTESAVVEGDRLGMSREAMRAAGYAVVDLLADLVADVGEEPALRRVSPAELQSRISGPPPEEGRGFEEVLSVLARDVLPFTARTDHPRYFAFIPTGGTWPGALGDFISSALTLYAGSWMEGAGVSHLEVEVLRWFADWLGFPPSAGGVLVTGGSAANLTALACAREGRVGAARADAIAYVSDQSHSSVARAARILGFLPEQVRILPVDDRFRLRPDVLAAAISADRSAGLFPLLVSAAAGSTNTGAIDPLEEIADVCAEQDVWMHVDGAYGGFSAMTSRGKRWLAGIERADSVTLDPHKWGYQPYECGALVVRDARRLLDAFAIEPDYLHDAAGADDEVNLSDMGMQLSRAARSLKLWMSIQTFGLDAFRSTMDRCLDLAVEAEELVRDSADLELLNPASLGIVCFRRVVPGIEDEEQLDAINTQLVADYEASGQGLVSSTRLRGRYAVRLCVMNHTSMRDDVVSALRWFADAPVPDVSVLSEASGVPAEQKLARDPDVGAVWGRHGVPADLLAGVPLFAGLSSSQLAAVARVAWEVSAAPGEAVVRRFESSRDFYVVLAGSLDVIGESERLLNQLGQGDVFGELAALDWGAGYGYPRLATVVAATPARLIAMPAAALNELMRQAPEVDARIRRIAQERAGRV
jgi:glutamate/tyrosine decarboxylase-like PLP-dependent enzyme